MDNMNFEQLRQMGMAPSRQIDMAPLNIPGVAQPASAPVQGVGNIDTRISELENMFANVYTNRAFTQQEMNDMNQKRQVLDNLYRIRESSQSRAVADEERKQKIEALKQVGEESKRKQQEAQTAKRNQVPSTYVLEQMGQNPFVSGGYMIDSSGRRIEVPKYGTVTPAMYQKLGQSVIEGKPAPSPSDFVQNTPYSQTQQRIERATRQGDYGKASMLAQQQINNLAQIAAMPGLTDEAKQILNANMLSLANQAKSNAGIYQEQIKAKALAQKAALDNQNKMEIERLKSDPKFQKLDQQTQSTMMKIYSDNFHKEVEVPVWDSTKNKWATNLQGDILKEKRRIIDLSPQQVESLSGRKISAKDYATENYKAQLQMLGIQPTEAPMPAPNVAPKGTQVNTVDDPATMKFLFTKILPVDPANPNKTADIATALQAVDSHKGYIMKEFNLSEKGFRSLRKAVEQGDINLIDRLTSPRAQGEETAVTSKKQPITEAINEKPIPSPLGALAIIAGRQGVQNPSVISNTSSLPSQVGKSKTELRNNPNLSTNQQQSILNLAAIADTAYKQGNSYTLNQLLTPAPLSPKGAAAFRSMMDSITEEPIITPPITNERQVMKPTIQDVAEAINEAELINRKRIANGEPPLDSRIFDLIDVWKQKIHQELYPIPAGKPSPEVEALSKPQRYINLNRSY